MSGHQHEACRPPRLLLRRWRNRLWICTCGQAWRTRLSCAYAGCAWLWERWPETPPDDSNPLAHPASWEQMD